jgi:hypothetical protein
MISRNGRAVVGFGDAQVTAPPNSRVAQTLADAFLGAAAGAGLGGLIGGKTGALIGVAVGGIGVGAVTYAVLGEDAAPAPSGPYPNRPSFTAAHVWRQLTQPTDNVKAGEEIAVTILGPNRTPLSPDLIAQLDAALALIPSYNVTALIAKYPPGTPPPDNDWPSDYVMPPGTRDDFGPGAYRVLLRALVDSPPTFWHSVPSNVGTFGIWAR